MQRYLNGKLTALTPSEQAARDAEETAWAAGVADRRRLAKREAFIAEGVTRITGQVADWDTVEAIKVAAGLWPAISATATAAQIAARDIYLYVRDTVPAKLAAIADDAALAAIDPVAADPFGDGTLWPT